MYLIVRVVQWNKATRTAWVLRGLEDQYGKGNSAAVLNDMLQGFMIEAPEIAVMCEAQCKAENLQCLSPRYPCSRKIVSFPNSPILLASLFSVVIPITH